MEFDVSILSSLEDIGDEWTRLEKDPSYEMYGFQSYEFASCWMDTIGKTVAAEPILVWVRDAGGRTLMLLPLVAMRRNGCRVLVFIGGRLADYFAPIVSKELTEPSNKQVFVEMWSKIKRRLPRIDAIHFQKMPEYIGDASNPFVAIATARGAYKSHMLIMPEKTIWEDFRKAKVDKKMLADSRRQTRRLSEKGELRFVVAENEADASCIVDAMIRQKSRRYRETEVRDIFSDASYRQFYKIMCKKHVSQLSHASALFLDERVLACHVGLVFRNRFYYLMPSYEAGEWRRFSPGRLHLEFLLEWADSRHIECFDFTIGDEAYKKIWSTQELDLYEYSEALSVKGHLYLKVEELKVYLQRHPIIYSGLIRLRNWMQKDA